MSQTPTNDIKLHSTAVTSMLKLICRLHSEGQYNYQMEVASSANVKNFKHVITSQRLVPIRLHPYPVLSLMSDEVAVGEVWKMMPELEQHFAILHADDLIPQLLNLRNELNVPGTPVPIKKIGLAVPGCERWNSFKEQLDTAGYRHRDFICGSTTIQFFPLTSDNGDKSVFGCGLGGVCVPVFCTDDTDNIKTSYDADHSDGYELEDTSDEDNCHTPKKRGRYHDDNATEMLFDKDSSSEDSSTSSNNGR
jgi:hypothetical protein